MNTFTGINGDWSEIEEEEVDGVKAGVSASSFQEEITRTFIDPVIQEHKTRVHRTECSGKTSLTCSESRHSVLWVLGVAVVEIM